MTVQHDTRTRPELAAALRESVYLPTMTLGAYQRRIAEAGPLLPSLLDFERPGADAALRALADTVTEFDSDGTGRGDSYRRAQRTTMVRWTGMRQILRLASPPASSHAGTVLDVLGGDGTIARAVSRAADATLGHMSVLTGDVSGTMVERALEQGLPAVRQSADFLFLRDGAVDATLLAYGTHHIAPRDRPAAVAEAVRVTRAGGRVLLHDFDESSPMARFFTEVVHPCSTAGHDYRHFSRPSLTALFDGAGIPASVHDLYDPLTVTADSEERARQDMCDHLRDMYGIRAFFDGHEDIRDAWNSLVRYFDHTDYLAATRLRDPESVPSAPVIRRRGNRYVAEVPRVALLAVGRTPPRT
ncbi:class I SAM-dependent methyltransferase [Streptomyces sp. NPDC059371]|uniref:class I SAM-dependent methyltransferase n=1 Tax=Streptomyces sp. NPDC059371 TaxID=3346812 RepID=UPI003695B7F3